MSKKDFKKGIAAQAKIDAAKEEKIAKGLKAHGEILNNISEHQNQIQSALDVIIADWADSDASDYGLESANLPSLMDITEKRVLCACVFTLLSSYNQNSESQQRFYNNLEEHLGVSERVSSFDFEKLQKIDSVSDRLKILQVICAFLFLNDESFEFLRDRNTFNWLFALAPVKDIANTCKRIDFEYNMLGIEGVVSRYKSEFINGNCIESEKTVDELPETSQSAHFADENYEELTSLIHSVVDDETAFGKRIEFSETEFEREIKKEYPKLAYDSLIATNRIGTGCIIFTTYAFYIKLNKLPASKYIEVPYESIIVEKMHTKAGKKGGTRCLVIVYKSNDNTEESISIDDGKLTEERLKDLLLNISSSGCKLSKTDKLIEPPMLEETTKILILSAMIYLLKKDKANLTDVFCMADELKITQKWNECYELIQDNDTYSSVVKKCYASIPHPSKRYVSVGIMRRAMQCLACSNVLKGIPASQMNSSFEKMIKQFDMAGIESSQFNKMMVVATDSFLKDEKYYSRLKTKYKISSFESFADIELGLDDLM